ncbi:MAG: DUF2268 domain-containing putative Zn-dependent protease [Patescibacteria group bacterium]
MSDDYQPLPIPENLAKQLAPLIDQWILEVKQLLPDLSEDLEYMWDNKRLIPDVGTGGFAVTPTLIALAYDPDFKNKELQRKELEGAVYHESYHTIQRWTGYDGKLVDPTALDTAIIEGAATVFERERTECEPIYGMYKDDETMHKWLDEVLQLPLDYDYRKYKFYDQETSRRFVLYKLGSWIIDGALAANPHLEVEDLVHMSPDQILQLAQLT